jgi:hypothetical protein
MVPVCRASVDGVKLKNFPLWKSNKKVLQCQFNSDVERGKRGDIVNVG